MRKAEKRRRDLDRLKQDLQTELRLIHWQHVAFHLALLVVATIIALLLALLSK